MRCGVAGASTKASDVAFPPVAIAGRRDTRQISATVATCPNSTTLENDVKTYGTKQMADSWRTVRKNTIQIAEEIPAEQYGFQATADTMTVGQMLAHLAMATYWVEQVHFEDQKSTVTIADFGSYFGKSGAMAAELTTKESIVDALISRGEALALNLEAITDARLEESVELPGGSKSRFEMLLGVKEHEMHHRAQLMLIERMLGIVPHLTRARQQR